VDFKSPASLDEFRPARKTVEMGKSPYVFGEVML
jgi:hypothetical protein